MASFELDPNTGDIWFHFRPQADFIGCLLTGVMAALPAFLEAFMKCLGSGGPSGAYQPGKRERCQ